MVGYPEAMSKHSAKGSKRGHAAAKGTRGSTQGHMDYGYAQASVWGADKTAKRIGRMMARLFTRQRSPGQG